MQLFQTLAALCVLQVVSLTAFATAASPPPWPLKTVTVSGTHYEIGFQLGNATKDLASQYLSDDASLREVILPFVKTSLGQVVLNSFVASHEIYFPEFMDELKGISDGSGVNLTTVFAVNFADELAVVLNVTSSHSSEISSRSCTDVHIHFGSNAVLHNEDNLNAIGLGSSLVNATICEDSECSHVLESFVAYTYPLKLPGIAFGINKLHAIGVSVNAVFPKHVTIGGRSNAFISRACLQAESVEDAVTIATQGPIAYGVSINVIDYSSSNFSANIELSNTNTSVKYIQNDSYVHVNMYRHLSVPQFTEASSVHRMARHKQLGKIRSISEAFEFLGDTADPKYPVYRDGNPPDCCSTLATAFFNTRNGTLDIWLENPLSSPEQPNMSLHVRRQ